MNKRFCKRKIRRLNIIFSDGQIEYSGISSDFSCNGLFIRTGKGFKEGTMLNMQLELESGNKIPLCGTVKRMVKTQISNFKNGMGVELVSVPKEYDMLIEELYR